MMTLSQMRTREKEIENRLNFLWDAKEIEPSIRAAAMAYALNQNVNIAKTLHELNYELITNFGEMSCIEFILTTEDGAFTISPTGQKVFVSKDDEAGLIIGTGRLSVNYTTIEEEGERHLAGCSSAVYKTWFDEKTIRELASKDENTGEPWRVLKVN